MKRKLLSIFAMLAVLLAVFSYDAPSKLPCDVVRYHYLDEFPPAFAQSSATATDPGLLPREYVQYADVPDSSMVKQIDKNTVLVFEQVTAGNDCEIEAYVRGQVLHIDIRKYAIFIDWPNPIFYAVITIPDGVTIKAIDTRYRNVFKTVFPNKTPK